MSKKFVIAAAAGSAAMLLIGFLLYGLVFAELFREGAIAMPGVLKERPAILWVLAGQAGFGILITLVVSWRGAASFAQGARTGALFGFLMAVGYDFAQYGTSNLWSLKATLLDPIITAVLVGSAGGVIGFMLGRDTVDKT